MWIISAARAWIPIYDLYSSRGIPAVERKKILSLNIMNTEEIIKEVENHLRRLSVEIKYGKGYFDGGLYRYRENRCIYLNRVNSEEFNLEILLTELKKMDWQSIECNPMIKELLTKPDQN